MDILAALTFVVIFAKAHAGKGDPCTTPDGKNATCVPLETCEVVFNAVSSKSNIARDFAIKSFCKTFDPDPLVCCESPGPVISPNYESKALPDRDVCGLEKETTRVIGGEVSKLGEFPWMAGVEFKSKRTGESAGIKCGGSIINNRYVLTTAHCLVNIEYEPDRVWLGEWKISTDPDCIELIANAECADPVQKFQIKEVVPHLFYSKRTGYNDIGLILLENEIKFSDYIRPICLPSPDLPAPESGTRMTVAGWGATENGTASDVLLKVNIPVVSNEECNTKLESRTITPHQLCAGGEAGKDSCQGDTGGPLMRTQEDKSKKQFQWYQEGVSSSGIGCGRAGYPAIYTRVSSYMNWIINIISEE